MLGLRHHLGCMLSTISIPTCILIKLSTRNCRLCGGGGRPGFPVGLRCVAAGQPLAGAAAAVRRGVQGARRGVLRRRQSRRGQLPVCKLAHAHLCVHGGTSRFCFSGIAVLPASSVDKISFKGAACQLLQRLVDGGALQVRSNVIPVDKQSKHAILQEKQDGVAKAGQLTAQFCSLAEALQQPWSSLRPKRTHQLYYGLRGAAPNPMDLQSDGPNVQPTWRF